MKINEMTLQIGSTLRSLMRERRFSLKSIERETGVPASTIAEWTNNRAPKNPVQVQKVAKLLGVSIHFLLFGVEDSEEPLTKLVREDIFSGTFEITIKKVKIK